MCPIQLLFSSSIVCRKFLTSFVFSNTPSFTPLVQLIGSIFQHFLWCSNSSATTQDIIWLTLRVLIHYHVSNCNFMNCFKISWVFLKLGCLTAQQNNMRNFTVEYFDIKVFRQQTRRRKIRNWEVANFSPAHFHLLYRSAHVAYSVLNYSQPQMLDSVQSDKNTVAVLTNLYLYQKELKIFGTFACKCTNAQFSVLRSA